MCVHQTLQYVSSESCRTVGLATLLTQPLSRLQCEVESVNVELKEFHSYSFIAFSFILAPAHFDVCSATCAECSVEPRQVWWVTAGVASGTAVPVPERVVSVPTVGVILSVAVEMLSHKGWWLWGIVVSLTGTVSSNTSCISLQVAARGVVSDGESVNVRMVDGFCCKKSFQCIC